MRAGRRRVADLELERLEATEASAGEPCDDVDPVALADELGEVGAAEGDAVEDVAVALQGQRRVAVAGRAGRG